MTNCFRELGRTLVFLTPLVAGCGSNGPDLKPVYPVTGSVFVDGEAAKGAVVMFHPLPIQTGRFDMIRSRGTVNENGRFQLTTFQTDDGAPEGEYAVTIYWPGKRTGKPDPNDENSDLPPDRLGLRYNDPATSKIRVQVTGPETSLESFELD
ncbi:MAG TPA: carboxypeptidase regulatory-like domain-containing protein [Planctomycetaceae bacterium]|nr:carboxypeptidase regulatory-like domain-containing protein [Planctomycetaceae bacterium]